jgi:hypothetical protein
LLDAKLNCAVPVAARMMIPKFVDGLAIHDWTRATPVELSVTVTSPVEEAVKLPIGVLPEEEPPAPVENHLVVELEPVKVTWLGFQAVLSAYRL